MKDGYKREITYMRLSVTDRCNFKCKYCKTSDCNDNISLLTFDEYYDICKCAVNLGVKKIRITGGEPLVRVGLSEFCSKLNSIRGLEELTLTTNGSLLNNMVQDLYNAGVSRLNISLDTLNKEKFNYISGTNKFDDVMVGLNKALSVGFKQVKINVVLMNGFNTDEISSFVDMTKHMDISVRFIELMPFGGYPDFDKQYVPAGIVLEAEPELELLNFSGVAQLYRKKGYKGTVGLIKPMSDKFCDVCNRIRITADGKIKTCLHSSEEYNLKGLKGEALSKRFMEAIANKPDSHMLTNTCFSQSLRYMNQIGG